MSVFTFLGDVNLNDENSVTVDLKIENPYVFNLEYVITGDVAKPKQGKVNLKSLSAGFSELFGSNPIAVNLANNHVMDFGEQGYLDTLGVLSSEGIKYFGTGSVAANRFESAAIVETNGLKIALLGYSVFDEHTENFRVELFCEKKAAEDIKEMRRQCADTIVVNIHWGIEESPLQQKNQEEIGRFLIDSGADLIIGHHPHCLQPYEIYKGKYIFYSLGNCIFPDIHAPSFWENHVSKRTYHKRQKKINKLSYAVHFNVERKIVTSIDLLCFERNNLKKIRQMPLKPESKRSLTEKKSKIITRLRHWTGFLNSNVLVDGKLFYLTAFHHEISMKNKKTASCTSGKPQKLLIVGNIGGSSVNSFSGASIKAQKSLELNVHVAANYKMLSAQEMIEDEKQFGITKHHIDFIRNPFHPGNIKAYRQLKKLLIKERFDVIQCSTPVGGLFTRLAAKICGQKNVIYQVHGFHFYKGAPLLNKTILKWAERLMAHWTDAIITINQEDFEAAKKFKLRKNGKIYHIPGVGIDTQAYRGTDIDRAELRKALGLKEGDIICIAMGDIIARKDYKTSIKAVAECNNHHVHLLICGQGPEKETLEKLAAELNVADRIHFLGFRTDIKKLLKISNVFLFATLQEGLPRSMMEAMAAGLPCVASKIRGNVDLIKDGEGGFLCETKDYQGFAEKLNLLAGDTSLRQRMGEYNVLTIKKYDSDNVKKELAAIYQTELAAD